MHITPADLRTVRRDGVSVRHAPLGPVAYLLTDVPARGAKGTWLEERCTDPHWLVVLRGALEVVREPHDHFTLSSGQVAYVPGGRPAHRLHTGGVVSVAAFAPLAPPASEREPAEPAVVEGPAEPGGPVTLAEDGGLTLVASMEPVPLRRGEIEAQAALMGPWIACGARFGGSSGYAASWCDLPHWGMVLAGSMAIEWEDDLEILGPGDAFFCPAGPPGHRFEVTDAAMILDFTPIEAAVRGGRAADWRPHVTLAAPAGLDGLPRA